MTRIHATMKPVIALYWLTAARAGFARVADWRAWADKQIISMPSPPIWLISMSLAIDLSDLRKAVEFALDTLELGKPTPGAIDDALLGYLWWRFERHELNLGDCLKLVGEAADASSSSVECETVYALLNELETEKRNEASIEATAREILSPLRRQAEQQWMEIQSYA